MKYERLIGLFRIKLVKYYMSCAHANKCQATSMENVGSFLFAFVHFVVRMKHGFEFKSELAAHAHVRITDRVCF